MGGVLRGEATLGRCGRGQWKLTILRLVRNHADGGTPPLLDLPPKNCEIIRRAFCFAAAFFFLSSLTAVAAPPGRFFLEGDGTVRLVNGRTGAGGAVTYRTPRGEYPESAQRRINRIFGVPPNASEGIAIRLIALLDYLQDQLKGGKIKIVSGYRSPTYNEELRKKGRLAARTSMHLEGMAADIEMEGVEGKRLWEFVRGLDCCGAGYYHGKGIHVDVGPSRFWDEASTKVEQDLGARNKLVLLRTGWDLYRPGEEVRMTLGRITDYPIGVRRDGQLIHTGQEVVRVRLENGRTDCLLIPNRSAASLAWKIPKGIAPKEKSRIRISFCHKPFPEMPEGIDSNPISIK
ncbi:MAG: YcbK family protein [Candidatus Methylomirabilales bacterium]